MKVKLKKISEAEMPRYKSANWDEYKVGIDNGDVSLPVDYELTGTMLREPAIGQSVTIQRDTRNGVECGGIFCCSVVKGINKVGDILFLETQNSVYQVEAI